MKEEQRENERKIITVQNISLSFFPPTFFPYPLEISFGHFPLPPGQVGGPPVLGKRTLRQKKKASRFPATRIREKKIINPEID